MERHTKHGFLLVNKPVGISSFYVVKKIKQLVPIKEKVGHAGTLDPLASGLLIIAIGKIATRYLKQCMHLPKEYLATGKLGELTDTLDLEGTVIQNNSVNNITHHIIEKSLISFGTHYTQTPPIYSALKHEGTPLYKFARTKKLPEEVIEQITKQKSKLVTLHTLELTNVDLPYFSIRTIVSHGTYIRVLLNDIAKKMETCATTHVLTRTAIGPFNINNAIDFSTLTTMESVEQAMISIEQSLDMIN